MNTPDTSRPWDNLSRLLEGLDPEEITDFIKTLSVAETVRAISRLSPDGQSRLLSTLSPEDAADLVEEIPDVQAAGIIEHLAPGTAAAILDELPSDEQADILGALEDPEAEAILAELAPQDARDARTLRSYPQDVAGGLMASELLVYPKSARVRDVVDDFRTHAEEYRDYDVQYAYVVSDRQQLVGVLRLRDLLLAAKDQRLSGIMIPHPLTVFDDAPLDELRQFFDRHNFLGVPVVDSRRRLVGVIRRAAVDEALAEESDRVYRRSQGIVGGEEMRTMPLLLRSRRRLAWLSVNVLLNILAASVIAFYQDTLAAVIALAVFLPIISDMSGCSGNQAVAVSMRELALGLVGPAEIVRVWGKEILVGLINGICLGVLVAAGAYVWKANPHLGLVVGLAMSLNTMIAVSIGGTVPLLLRRLNVDPALASGPILTTITDMSGFFILLSLASAWLPRLTAG